MSKVYIFLGTAGCGRRRLIAQLIEEGFAATTTTLYIVEPERDAEAEKIFATISGLDVASWKFDDDSGNIVAAATNSENVILLADGEDDPVDQMEAFAALVKRRPEWKVVRVATVVDCSLAAGVPESAEWFRACIHFSDVVLLANRDNAGNAWVKNFQDSYKKECFPCIFILVKKGKVDNPALVLDDTPRRLSMIFDDQDPIDDIEFDEENLPEEPFDLVSPPDPYFATTDAGDRKIVLPKTGDLLAAWDKIRPHNNAK
ncbi:MAG: hypothetical protein LUD39_03840 [Opitutae bacterium]|nr:hypothetical protein [Opitutae bacterium]